MSMWRRVPLWVVMLVAVWVAGCQGAGPSQPVAVRPTDLGPLIDALDARDLGYTLQWATDLGVSGNQTLSYVEALGDVIVCVESPSNMVTAISLREGNILWRSVVGKPADKLFAPVRRDDRLLINSEQLLYSVDIKTGQMIEVSRLQSLVNHAPAVVGDTVVYGGLNHRVFAHDFRAGYSRWAYQLTERVFAQPATFGPNVFVADGNGVYAMFVAATGQLLWKGRTFSRVSAQPAMSHMGVFVASEDHALYALDGATGRDRWIFHTTEPLTRSPYVFPNTVILPLPGRGVIVAIHARTGAKKWQLPFMAEPIYQFEDTLLLHTDYSLLVVDIGSGKIFSEVPVHRLRAVIHIPDRQLVLVSPGGRLLLMAPQS